MKIIPTTLLALLMAGATTAHAKDVNRGEPAPTEQEELAIAALEGLMAQPRERALPILKKVLAGNQSTVVKRRALFVLAQVGGPQGREILLQAARSNPKLREEAIRSIGISGDAATLTALQADYTAGDSDLKEEILQAWMIAGRKELVYQAAVTARTEDEASAAIRMLGVMGAKDELRKLADSPNTPDGLVDALAISGDLAGLRKIVDGKGPKDLREDAVQRIGIINSDAARTALREIYTASTDEDIKDAARQGMLISQDEKGLLAIYRASTNMEEKRSLLRTLSMMNSDAAIEAIDAALEKK